MNFLISFLNNSRSYISKIRRKIIFNCNREIPELCYALDMYDQNSSAKPKNALNILDSIIGNGFVWAVPKHRRSLERRMTRRMGFGKLLIPKNNIIVCNKCGHFHPVHTICGNCYEKVKQETDVMKEAIMKELHLNPIDREIVVLYEDDPKEKTMYEGKRIVEVPKERPQWFSKNLLAKDSEIPRAQPKTIGTASAQPTVTNDDK